MYLYIFIYIEMNNNYLSFTYAVIHMYSLVCKEQLYNEQKTCIWLTLTFFIFVSFLSRAVCMKRAKNRRKLKILVIFCGQLSRRASSVAVTLQSATFSSTLLYSPGSVSRKWGRMNQRWSKRACQVAKSSTKSLPLWLALFFHFQTYRSTSDAGFVAQFIANTTLIEYVL